MLHISGAMLFGRDLPKLLEADAVLLGLVSIGEIEVADQTFRERATRAFGNKSVLAAQFHAANEVLRRLAVAADAHVAGRDASNGTTLVVEHFGCCEARIDFDAEFGRLFA